MATKRKDSHRIVLKKGEYQRTNGTYAYRWTDGKGKRHEVYARDLDDLRAKEKEIDADTNEGIKVEARYVIINEMYDLWEQLKRGIKDNTFENYKYMYNTFVRPSFGKKRIQTLKKSDVKIFYNYLADQRCLQASTIDSIHNVLHQVLDMAVDDKYIRSNPSDKALKELKQSHAFKTEKRRALTIAEQELFLNYLRNNETYSHWYPIFAVMLGTGMRVGEITGLRWCDIDLDNGVIDINHTLVYYCHRHEVELNGCYFNINTPKTKASNRKIPMIESVKEAFLMEKANQEKSGIKCSAVIDGYSDFIFVNRNGKTQHQGTLNKAIRRIIRDCNDEVLLNDENATVLLPHFSCHSLRHTFSTRMCEAGINVKVIQDTLGHQDISTKQEFESLDNYLKKAV